jgi:hypothetical protein
MNPQERGMVGRRGRDGGVDWVDLAQETDKWRALVKTVMNLRVPLDAENFLTS